MKQQSNRLARAAALLLAAAALPLTPAISQETTTPPPDATTSIPPPEATTPVQPTITQTPDPVTPAETAPAPTTAPAATTAPAESTPTRTVTRRTTTTRTTRAPARIAPAPVAVAPAPVETLPPEAAAPLPPPVAQTPPLEAFPEPAPATTTVETQGNGAGIIPWLIAGLAIAGALAAFALRRRRRRTDVYDDVHEQAYEPAVAPLAAAAPIVTPTDSVTVAGRPKLDLAMNPVRAGVSGSDARVEFELIVGNNGPVAAEDVRISTWMLASGTSEAESALIVPRDHADTRAVSIGAGESRTLEASVALPTSQVEGDAVLPVVVADARYRLPDGSEGRTSASFAVGVPDGEELAHFATDNPSGLHDDVVARPLGEVERV